MVGFYMIKVAKLKPPKLISTQKNLFIKQIELLTAHNFLLHLVCGIFFASQFFSRMRSH